MTGSTDSHTADRVAGGDPSAVVAAAFLWVPAAPSLYKLPWSAATDTPSCRAIPSSTAPRTASAGVPPTIDDAMRFAWDFALPEGTEVVAARGGTVALANGSWRPDHCGAVTATGAGGIVSPFIGNEANFVEIDHGDGTSALYLHLSEVAPEIERKAKTGEPVLQGELLGLSRENRLHPVPSAPAFPGREQCSRRLVHHFGSDLLRGSGCGLPQPTGHSGRRRVLRLGKFRPVT